MKHNFDYSLSLLQTCLKHDIRLIYASSASVYGDGPFHEEAYLNPKNVYANSKRVFDNYAESFISCEGYPQIVGLRYFNVYGPMEHRKGAMASVVHQFKKQIDTTGEIRIFEGSHGFLRDFIYIDDIVSGVLGVFETPPVKDDENIPHRVLNIGNNNAEKLMDFIATIEKALDKKADIDFQPMQPGDVKETFADIDETNRLTGYKPTTSIAEGVPKFVDWYKSYYDV